MKTGLRGIFACAMVSVALAASAGAASADVTFGGTCDVAGTAKFEKPLKGGEMQPNHYDFTGTGTCSGLLNGAQVDAAPVEVAVGGDGNLSCSGSESTAPGPGKFVFTEKDVTVPFTLEFTAIASEVDLVLKGQKSGEGTGHASFLTPDLPPDTLIKCETDGVNELPFEASAETTSPFVSPSPAAAMPGPSPTAGAEEKPAQPKKTKKKKKCKPKKKGSKKKKKCKPKRNGGG